MEERAWATTRYRPIRLIGEGGMGKVYEAVDTETNRPVALKVLVSEFVRDEKIVQRFLNEGRAAGRIRSKHIATVYDVGTRSDGTPYLAMEYLQGADLQGILERRGTIPYQEAVDWLLEGCEALAEAHALQLIHRDLKPSNFFLADTDEGPTIKLLDFGVSKSVGDGGGLSVTKTTQILGSPVYMSPEQLKSAKDVDERSDIWSLGVTLYELLSGERPFDAPSLPELSVAILSSTGPKPLLNVPSGLNRVLSLALTKERADRFTNLADFADALALYGTERGRESAKRIIDRLGLPSKRAPSTQVPTLTKTAAMEGAPASTPRFSVTTANDNEPITAPHSVTKTVASSPSGTSRLPLAVGAIVLATLGAGVFLFGVRGAPSKPVPITAIPASVQPATAEPSVATAPPLPSPASPASASASATATATTTTTPTTTAPASASPPTVARPRASTPTSQRPATAAPPSARPGLFDGEN